MKPAAMTAWAIVGSFVGALIVSRAFEIAVPGNPPMPRIGTWELPNASGADSPLFVDLFIRDRCASAWPDDYRMQKHCVDNETQAANQIAVLQGQHLEGSEEWKILARCLDRWAGVDISGADFRMSKYCFDQELAAYQTLY